MDEILPWGNDPGAAFDNWKKDMSLREAIGMSNIYIYQELARRTGLAALEALGVL